MTRPMRLDAGLASSGVALPASRLAGIALFVSSCRPCLVVFYSLANCLDGLDLLILPCLPHFSSLASDEVTLSMPSQIFVTSPCRPRPFTDRHRPLIPRTTKNFWNCISDIMSHMHLFLNKLSFSKMTNIIQIWQF